VADFSALSPTCNVSLRHRPGGSWCWRFRGKQKKTLSPWPVFSVPSGQEYSSTETRKLRLGTGKDLAKAVTANKQQSLDLNSEPRAKFQAQISAW
jgi:hypothetical protein